MQNKDKKVSYDEFRQFVMLLPSINIRAIWNSHRVHRGIDIGEDMVIPDEPSSSVPVRTRAAYVVVCLYIVLSINFF